MYEHRTQPLLPRKVFYRRLARNFIVGLAVVCAALLVGMFGYHFLESLPWLDAYLNAAMILSGMGPVDPVKTVPGKVFAGAYALFSGIALLSSAGIIFAPVFHRFIHKFHLESDDAPKAPQARHPGPPARGQAPEK
jgi:hypothetical protein